MNTFHSILLIIALILLGCNTPSGNNNAIASEVKNQMPKTPTQNSAFNQYIKQFPDLKLPYPLTEQQLKTFRPKAKSITVKEAEQYICFKGNVYECVVSPEDSETVEGIDIRKDFKIIGKITAPSYVLLVYLFDDEFGYYQAIATSYSLNGKPISSTAICGLASDYNSLVCELFPNKIQLTKTEYKYGHKNNPDKVVKADNSTLSIDASGRF